MLIVFIPCFNIGSFCAIIQQLQRFFLIYIITKDVMQFLDFNFVTMFYIRKIKDEHRIISSATNKEVGFSSEQHFSCARIFVKIEIDRPLTYCIFTAFECYFFVL